MEEQTELRKLINNLKDYGPRISKKKIEEKNRVLESAIKLKLVHLEQKKKNQKKNQKKTS